MRLALFDCDGTLVDSQHAIVEAMETAFAAHALDLPDPNRVRRVVGLSLDIAVQQLLPDHPPAQIAEVAASYKAAFQAIRARPEHDEPLYPGIRDLLDRLRDEGWRLGIVTGKSRRGLAATLAAHGLTDRFVTLQTADTNPSKPDPAMVRAALAEAGPVQPEAAVVIGDTVFDMQMARLAGIRAVGVAWGYHPPEALHEAGAATVVSDATALRRALADD